VTPSPGELEIGRVGRAHGVHGEVTVTFVSNRRERAEPGAVMHAGNRTLVVASARPHHDKWLVHFEGVDDRTAAEALRGDAVVALADDEFWVHDLIGSAVVESRGATLGRVVAIEANPAHDLLVLDQDVLVPLPFVVERHDDGTIVVELPEGLLEL
jgi:16S rRNA processing protein RimM